jgi:putative phosphoesterase
MTRIVVMADTHRLRGHELPAALDDAIRGADLVAHLGDFTGVEMADYLEKAARLVAVHGNNDVPEIRHRYPQRANLLVGGRRITLIHGDVGGITARRAAQTVRDADIVLFGHSHAPLMERNGERLLLNPGSPTQRRFARHATFGILTLHGEVAAEIVPVDTPR